MNGTLKEHHIKINHRKTKVLVCNKQQIYANIVLDGLMLEKVQNVDTYLGSKIPSIYKSHTNTIKQIVQSKQLFYSFKKKYLYTSNTVSLDTK